MSEGLGKTEQVTDYENSVYSELKDFARTICKELTDDELVILKGAITLIQKQRYAVAHGKSYDEVCLCPIEGKAMTKKGAKKIILEKKRTRYSISTTWIYLSRKAFNRIIKRIE